MFRKGLGQVLGLGLVLILFFAYAFAEESITITTYYPSPYGSYNELQTNKLAVGTAKQPSNPGNIRLKAQSGDPATKTGAFADGQIGEVAYSESQDALYHYNGNTWVAQGGAGGVVISLKCKWPTGNFGGSSSCTPPSCPLNWIDVGTGCASAGAAAATEGGGGVTSFIVGYCERWCYKQ